MTAIVDVLSATYDAVYRRLKAAEPQIGFPVFDAAPEGAPQSYVAIGELDTTNTSDKADQIERITLEVHVIYLGDDKSAMLAAMHQARLALDQQSLTHDAVVFAPPRFIAADTSKPFQAEGQTMVGMIQFVVDGEPA